MDQTGSILTEFFKSIGAEEVVAEADACKVKHDLSSETFEAIRKAVTIRGKLFTVKDPFPAVSKKNNSSSR